MAENLTFQNGLWYCKVPARIPAAPLMFYDKFRYFRAMLCPETHAGCAFENRRLDPRWWKWSMKLNSARISSSGTVHLNCEIPPGDVLASALAPKKKNKKKQKNVAKVQISVPCLSYHFPILWSENSSPCNDGLAFFKLLVYSSPLQVPTAKTHIIVPLLVLRAVSSSPNMIS